MTLRPLAFAAVALALTAPAAHAINKCVDKAGGVTYQEGRCPDDAKENELKGLPQPGDSEPAPAGGAAGDGDPEDPHMLDVVAVMVGYEGCTKALPEFASTRAAQYDKWRAANARYLARLEHSARYQEVLAKGRKQNAAHPLDSPEFIQKYTRFCNVQFIGMLARNTSR